MFQINRCSNIVLAFNILLSLCLTHNFDCPQKQLMSPCYTFISTFAETERQAELKATTTNFEGTFFLGDS